MYSLAEKNKIIELFKKGEKVASIKLMSNISRSTLYKWKKDFEVSKEKSKKVKKFIKNGELKEAEILANEILDKNPKDIYARVQLTTIYIRQKRLQEAKKLANEILQSNPNNIATRVQLTTIYIKQNRLQEAEKSENEILELDPNNIPARIQLVIIYYNQGKEEQAEKIIEELKQSGKNDSIKIERIDFFTKMYRKMKKENIPTMTNKKIKEQNDSSNDKNSEAKDNTLINGNKTQKEAIKSFRKQIYNGEITLENISDFETEISSIPEFDRKMLLAEAYTHLNLAEKAKQLLKEAENIENISEKQQRILKQAIQITQSSKMNSILKNKKWGQLTGTYEEYQH